MKSADSRVCININGIRFHSISSTKYKGFIEYKVIEQWVVRDPESSCLWRPVRST